MLFFDHGDGIRFFHIRAELCKYFIKGNAHRDGQAQLPLNGATDHMSDPLAAAEQRHRARHIQPALVQTKGLHHIGIAVIYLFGLFGIIHILLKVRRYDDQIGTPQARLPNGLPRLDPLEFRLLILGKDDSVALLGIAADRHVFIAQGGVVPALHRSVKIIHITMQNHPFHTTSSLTTAILNGIIYMKVVSLSRSIIHEICCVVKCFLRNHMHIWRESYEIRRKIKGIAPAKSSDTRGAGREIGRFPAHPAKL